MGRRTPMLLALLGCGQVALALGIYVGWCGSSGVFPLLVTGYVAGVALLGAALVLRIGSGVVMSIVVLLGVAAIAFAVAFVAVFAAFSRCFVF
ncbi:MULTISPECIES: hypothetical protein [unclassified Nonomuraea]|uniref:hypothetical protein n=1 Tax=unclassified Nonomuraea TaxID=2593643 RepID=UPI0033E4C3B5